MSETPPTAAPLARPRLRELVEGGPRRLVFVWSILLAMGALVYFFAVPEMRAYYHAWRADGALANYDVGLARRHLEKCLKFWKKSPELHFRAARCCWRDGDFETAQRHLGRAVRLGWPRDAANLEQALISAQLGLTRELEINLLNYLNRLGQADDRDTVAATREALAVAYLREYRLAEAEALARAAVTDDDANWRHWNLLGAIVIESPQPEQAVAAFERSLKLRPDQPLTRFWLASALVAVGDGAKALEQLRLARRDDAADWETNHVAARAHYLQGQWEPARAAAQAALARGGETEGRVLALRGLIELEADGPAAAGAWLAKAEALAPQHIEVLEALLTLAQRRGDAAQAAIHAQRKASHHEAAKRLPDLQRQLADLRQQADVPPKQVRELTLEIGETLFRVGQDHAAARVLDKLLHEFPDAKEAHQALARYYRRIGDVTQAVVHEKSGTR